MQGIIASGQEGNKDTGSAEASSIQHRHLFHGTLVIYSLHVPRINYSNMFVTGERDIG